MMRRFLFLILVVSLNACTLAHDLDVSGIRFIIQKSGTLVSVMVHRSQLEASQKGKSLTEREMEIAIRQQLKIAFAGKPIEPKRSFTTEDSLNDLVTWQALVPGTGDEFEVPERLFVDNPKSKTIISVVKEGRIIQEVVLDSDHPSWIKKRASANLATTFLRQGFEHILSGADHVLFVLGLILLGGSVKSLIKTVTAFTLAHSITLSLAATGVWNPPSKVIEPLIALSIVVIAIENLRSRKEGTVINRDFRPYVAFLFGLVHGFGFAGALVDAGLANTALAFALVFFNLGVESGQAAIILISVPLIAWIAMAKPVQWQRVTRLGSVGIGMIGTFWFAVRISEELVRK